MTPSMVLGVSPLRRADLWGNAHEKISASRLVFDRSALRSRQSVTARVGVPTTTILRGYHRQNRRTTINEIPGRRGSYVELSKGALGRSRPLPDQHTCGYSRVVVFYRRTSKCAQSGDRSDAVHCHTGCI